ncbi:thioredoxin family protein [Paenibacillus sp. GSMTC-2017]|uniref:thioredoxin family protein n=1 Tax=Paenibacillus sp. GSMTC-2017 TaxID=2794350 RepID=UPI0018D74B6A|nr:thioredoxin family protein [Paenibacillus sp. GSMTC-2017]MBH5319160.1 thioredoxin family protein [Paenibacillus sp. GSMTC-2017]
MSKSVADKLGKGISPKQFVDGMNKNKEIFVEWMEKFSWPSEEDQQYFESLNNRDDLRCLILMAEWCGDVARNVPVIFKALENSGIPTEVLIIEEHMETMDQYLTMGGRAIPIVIFADTGGAVLGQWGPRSKYVQEPMIAFKTANPDREAADYQDNLAVTRQEIMRRYGEGTGYQADIVNELRVVLESL